MTGAEVAQILTALATFVASTGAVVVGIRNSAHIMKVEKATNGMKTELVNEVRQASFAAGEKSEKDKMAE